ncbi:M14 family zinc carboxypeptidase [Nocardioides sp. L-11A]|uniref:M14 family zinc carboxypeptidase n=1 Tax=Nocardioides sp. L-11A TaxID=3043848 RepID=UPI00249C22C5|nr:M14 family zinc carboxypeptidase [Nocardioides sp. L-11A]
MSAHLRRKRFAAYAAGLALFGLAVGVLPSESTAAPAPRTAAPQDDAVLERDADETPRVVEIVVPGTAELDRLVATGVDLDHGVHQEPDGLAVRAVVTPGEIRQLEALGFEVGETLMSAKDSQAAVQGRDATIAANQQAADAFDAEATDPDVSDVKILRADYYTSFGTPVLSVEAQVANGGSLPTLTVERDSGPGTAFGSGGSQNLAPFNDAGVYMYHMGASSSGLTTRPDRVRITSPSGDTAIAKVADWLPTADGEEDPFKGPGYQEDFIQSYLDPTQLYDRIKQLADTYPDLAEIVELPYKTNGYRRLAQALVGPTANNPTAISQRFGVDSKAWGHQGGNGITVEVADPGAPDSPLSVHVVGKAIKVSAATDGTGALTSTAAQIVAAINANVVARTLVTAYTYRNDAGAGVTPATALPVTLTDGLGAPASVSRDPQQVYAIKIGKVRDGSKPGVFYYAQEHAREWVPPLVTIETAERLLRNYSSHAGTRDLVDNLEIWILPSVNPDGGHYSFYDFASQRKNMTRHCAVADSGDFNGRNSWGVDVNRNYTEYSAFDGYSGASTTSCTSGTSAGPGELTEPEAKNVDWVAKSNPNITFSMNVHSSGNYFMWSPASYKAAGRETAPVPTLEEEGLFWGASSRILTAIKRHRGLSVTPAKTGQVVDVLYSAAGNSGDLLWYKYGIYAWDFEVGGTFQPPFENVDPNGFSAHAESQEFANGLIEMAQVALDHERDDVPPVSTVAVTPSSEAGKVNVEFETNEPAAIFYTLDGTVPTLDSERYDAAGLRNTRGERLKVDEGAEIRWITVDSRGNVERHLVPGEAGNFRAWKAEVGYEEPLASSGTSLTLSAAKVAVGATGVTARVQVTATGPGDQETPSGVVTVRDGDTVVGTGEIGADGAATLTLKAFPSAGSRSLTAEYGGDANFQPSVSAPVTLVVGKTASTVTAKVKKAKKLTVGKRPKLKVAVAAPGADLAGTVTVAVDGKQVATTAVGADGAVTVKLPKAKAGKHKVTVTYVGSASAEGSVTTVKLKVPRR